MPVIRNASPRGALDVPLLARDVDADEEVEVTQGQATLLLAQVDNWHPVDDDAAAILLSLQNAAYAETGGVIDLDDADTTDFLDDDEATDEGDAR